MSSLKGLGLEVEETMSGWLGIGKKTAMENLARYISHPGLFVPTAYELLEVEGTWGKEAG